MEVVMRLICALVALSSAILSAQSPYLTQEQRDRFHGADSEPVEPFRVIGNIYYVGAQGLSSYLITTPEGHILHDTGTTEMHEVIVANVEKLGFDVQDIKFMLSSHAHFDHMQGHAAMKRATGARIVALGGDAAAIDVARPLDRRSHTGRDDVDDDGARRGTELFCRLSWSFGKQILNIPEAHAVSVGRARRHG